MKIVRIACIVISLFSLVVCLYAALCVFTHGVRGGAPFATYRRTLGVASLVWFLTAPVWMIPELFGLKKK